MEVVIVRDNLQNRLEFRNGFSDIRLLHIAAIDIAQSLDINARQQAMRVHIIGILPLRLLALLARHRECAAIPHKSRQGAP